MHDTTSQNLRVAYFTSVNVDCITITD